MRGGERTDSLAEMHGNLYQVMKEMGGAPTAASNKEFAWISNDTQLGKFPTVRI